MQIKKQSTNIGKAIFSGEIKSEADGSIIVPDVKPDILKVLQVDAESFLEEKTIDNGKLILKGKVYVNVLYIPDQENGCVQCIKGVFDFCETLKRSEFDPSMDIRASCDISRVGYKVINSRKLGIEAHVLLNVDIISEKNISFVCGVESDAVEISSKIISLKDMSMNKDFVFQIEDKIELPCRSNVEILKVNAVVLEKEIKAITGKIIAKGKVNLSILYVTENGNYEHIDVNLPFTEVFDWEDAEEDSEYDVSFEILENEYKLENSTDDEKYIISYLKIKLTLKKDSFKESECVLDCYFTDSDCEFEFCKIPCEEICAKPMQSAMVKQVIDKDDNLPGISKIYTIQAKPIISSTDILTGNISISGRIPVCILYISDDENIPLSGITEEIPFTQTIECPNVSRECDILLAVECEHISYTLNSESSIEVRCGILIKGKIIKKNEIEIISDINFKQLSERENAMIVYFVKENDSLWDIGKQYHVKCDDILKCNKMSKEDICLGQKIVIPMAK